MQEYTKAAWELTKTPEFQAALEADVAEANRSVTHADFVAGVQSGGMGFKCMFGTPYQFIRGSRRTIFGILVMFYMVAPAIFIPLWAWHEHNWWLLLGIAVSFVGNSTAAQLTHNQEKQYSLASILFIFSAISWYRCGIHNYYTFFPLCALWGLMFFMIADNAEEEYALQSLVENPDVFKDAIARNKIMVVRKEGKK